MPFCEMFHQNRQMEVSEKAFFDRNTRKLPKMAFRKTTFSIKNILGDAQSGTPSRGRLVGSSKALTIPAMTALAPVAGAKVAEQAHRHPSQNPSDGQSEEKKPLNLVGCLGIRF